MKKLILSIGLSFLTIYSNAQIKQLRQEKLNRIFEREVCQIDTVRNQYASTTKIFLLNGKSEEIFLKALAKAEEIAYKSKPLNKDFLAIGKLYRERYEWVRDKKTFEIDYRVVMIDKSDIVFITDSNEIICITTREIYEHYRSEKDCDFTIMMIYAMETMKPYNKKYLFSY